MRNRRPRHQCINGAPYQRESQRTDLNPAACGCLWGNGGNRGWERTPLAYW
ncbi:hypothetical protein GCM10009784_31550 [Arthrobacter parietis]|uniref:Uncharacterized protein n=1 Tax=Arthrobacter parietis TaxID=271434 RepID=A0ABN3B2P1_9MICC